MKAWTVVPGGQSRNPVSPHYRDRLERWLAGELESVPLPQTPADLPPAQVSARLTLEKGE